MERRNGIIAGALDDLSVWGAAAMSRHPGVGLAIVAYLSLVALHDAGVWTEPQFNIADPVSASVAGAILGGLVVARLEAPRRQLVGALATMAAVLLVVATLGRPSTPVLGEPIDVYVVGLHAVGAFAAVVGPRLRFAWCPLPLAAGVLWFAHVDDGTLRGLCSAVTASALTAWVRQRPATWQLALGLLIVLIPWHWSNVGSVLLLVGCAAVAAACSERIDESGADRAGASLIAGIGRRTVPKLVALCLILPFVDVSGFAGGLFDTFGLSYDEFEFQAVFSASTLGRVGFTFPAWIAFVAFHLVAHLRGLAVRASPLAIVPIACTVVVGVNLLEQIPAGAPFPLGEYLPHLVGFCGMLPILCIAVGVVLAALVRSDRMLLGVGLGVFVAAFALAVQAHATAARSESFGAAGVVITLVGTLGVTTLAHALALVSRLGLRTVVLGALATGALVGLGFDRAVPVENHWIGVAVAVQVAANLVCCIPFLIVARAARSMCPIPEDHPMVADFGNDPLGPTTPRAAAPAA